MYNCLGQRGQIKLFSDSVCAAHFWGNSNPNTENSFKFIFFIFDLHCTSVGSAAVSLKSEIFVQLAVLYYQAVSRLKLASVHLLLWTWACKVKRRRQVLYGNLFICLIWLCLIQLYVTASEICEEKSIRWLLFEKSISLWRVRQGTIPQKSCPIWLLSLKK